MDPEFERTPRKVEDFNQTNLDDFSVRAFAIFESPRCPRSFSMDSLISFYFWSILEHPGSTQGPPRISLEAAGASKDLFVGSLRSRDFPRNPRAHQDAPRSSQEYM